jgi:hypothetical protein
MYLSAQMTLAIAILFAIVCCASVAITGFMSLGDLTDRSCIPTPPAFARFWTFLTVVAVVFGVVSWGIMRKEKGKA